MLHFEESYFQGEERLGFFVESKMKHAWAAEVEVLAEIIRVCKKHGITYYADWGTLLGAVRHGGFIPWDDDIDIALKRKDYERLLAVLPDELPKSWNVASIYTSEDRPLPQSCVLNSREINTEPEFLERFHGCPYIVGVDVYPLDYVPSDDTLAETQRLLYNVVYDAAHRCTELEQSGEMEMYIPKIEDLCNVKLDRNRPLRRQLWLLGDQICTLFGEEESDSLTWFPMTVRRNTPYRMSKEWYGDTIEMPFENINISVPVGYHQILTVMFGEDYMTPQNIGGQHEYPFYKKQDEYLRRTGGR